MICASKTSLQIPSPLNVAPAPSVGVPMVWTGLTGTRWLARLLNRTLPVSRAACWLQHQDCTPVFIFVGMDLSIEERLVRRIAWTTQKFSSLVHWEHCQPGIFLVRTQPGSSWSTVM